VLNCFGSVGIYDLNGQVVGCACFTGVCLLLLYLISDDMDSGHHPMASVMRQVNLPQVLTLARC